MMTSENISLKYNNITKCVNSIKLAIDRKSEIDPSVIYNIPEPIASEFESLLCSVHDYIKIKDEELKALGCANVRMLLLTEAISDWKSIDFDLKKSGKLWETSLFMESLKDIMDATGAQNSLIIILNDDGEIGSINDIGLKNIQYIDFFKNNISTIIKHINLHESIMKISCLDGDNDYCDLISFDKCIKSALIVPIYSGNNIRGIIMLTNKKEVTIFDENDSMAAELFSKEISHFVERNDLLIELKKEKLEQEELVKEIQRTQTQLLQSEKMASIGSLAAGVAHEINNPVGYISSNIRSLKNYITDLFTIIEQYEKLETKLPDELLDEIRSKKSDMELDYIRNDILELVSESEEGVNRVKRIVQDLKDFSHVDEAEWQWANIHSGINSTLNIVHNETKYTTEIIKDYGDIPYIECIISQLNQVFMNLIVNSAHAIDGKGTITIKTDMLDNDHIRICFTDTGRGISKDNLKRIFDPFFTTKPVGKGTGLGLPLSFGIIEKHHGKIDVESKIGVGTKANIILPVNQPSPRAE